MLLACNIYCLPLLQGNPPRTALVEVEPAVDTRDMPIWRGPSDLVLPEDQAMTQTDAEQPAYLWQKGAAGPGLFVASLLAAATGGLSKVLCQVIPAD